ncbi:cell wall assembly regulator SMI1 [Kitasatospora sp. MAA19]|uniref:DUF6461 domain-containing protein n=1 Tax=Kitasatospora sp. MAA19 TaxID=3035090 RepID=UPI002473CC99|nr:DUF6461 domain-containing protein [Kitasatospora sp. MAA19]MDH6709822.1 cell wall assembly regulator SMI1 [Kitasatospora sp. MAA19]
MSRALVEESWKRIESWLAEHAAQTLASLLPRAELTVIKAAERTLGLRFPPDLVALLLRYHDGAAEGPAVFRLGGRYEFHSVKQMTEDLLRMNQALAEVNEQLDDDIDLLEGSYWHRQFLPIGNWTGTYLLVLDCRPGPDFGRVGQLSHGEGTSFGTWESLGQLLAEQAEALETGRPLDGWTPVAFGGRLSWDLVQARLPEPRSLLALAAAAEQPASPAPSCHRHSPVPAAGWVGDHARFCLTFVREVDRTDLLRRYGAQDDTEAPRTQQEADDTSRAWTCGYLPVVRTGLAGGWAFGFESGSSEGERAEVLRRLSAGTRAVSVTYNTSVRLAVYDDGELTTSYDTLDPEQQGGSQPDLLRPALRDAGLVPLNTARYPDEDVRAVLDVLSSELGIAMDHSLLDGPLPSARVLPVPDDLVPTGRHLVHSPFDSRDNPVIACALAFTPQRRLRAAVVEQARLLAAETGLDGYPEIIRALDGAAAGEVLEVTDENELGMVLRTLAAEARAGNESQSDDTARDLLSYDDRRAWHVRSAAARAIALAVSAPARTAAPAVLSKRLDPHWRTGFMAQLGDAPIPADALERLAEREAVEWSERRAALAALSRPYPPVARPTRHAKRSPSALSPRRGLGRGLGRLIPPPGASVAVAVGTPGGVVGGPVGLHAGEDTETGDGPASSS